MVDFKKIKGAEIVFTKRRESDMIIFEITYFLENFGKLREVTTDFPLPLFPEDYLNPHDLLWVTNPDGNITASYFRMNNHNYRGIYGGVPLRIAKRLEGLFREICANDSKEELDELLSDPHIRERYYYVTGHIPAVLN